MPALYIGRRDGVSGEHLSRQRLRSCQEQEAMAGGGYSSKKIRRSLIMPLGSSVIAGVVR